jgi:hypothetical protein
MAPEIKPIQRYECSLRQPTYHIIRIQNLDVGDTSGELRAGGLCRNLPANHLAATSAGIDDFFRRESVTFFGRDNES